MLPYGIACGIDDVVPLEAINGAVEDDPCKT
jgi:hypothetical protein